MRKSREQEYAENSGSSDRGLFAYEEALGADRFFLEKCKWVVNLGSGVRGKFEQDVAMEGIEVEIIPIDPNQPRRDSQERLIPGPPGVIAALGSKLPLADESVGGVLAHTSVPYYGDVVVFRNVLSETIRVLWRDGEGRFFPVFRSQFEAVKEFLNGNTRARFTFDEENYRLTVKKLS